MLQRLFTVIKAVLVVSLLATILSGCGDDPVRSIYPLESVSQKDGQTSMVYRAENKTVPEVATELADERRPDEISKVDKEHMFLIYPDEWYHLQRDPKKPSDTLIEVDNKEFVQQNYQPSFLEGFFFASVLHDLLDYSKPSYGHYRGYGSRDKYKPIVVYHVPTPKEKQTYPPITKEGTGAIIKRGSSKSGSSIGSGDSIFKKGSDSDSSTGGQGAGKIIRGSSKSGSSIGSGGSIFKKDSDSDSSTGGESTGKTIRSSSRSSYSSDYSGSWSGSSNYSPKSNSPPKTSVGGSGSIFRRSSRR